jgi:hypothetical protein
MTMKRPQDFARLHSPLHSIPQLQPASPLQSELLSNILNTQRAFIFYPNTQILEPRAHSFSINTTGQLAQQTLRIKNVTRLDWSHRAIGPEHLLSICIATYSSPQNHSSSPRQPNISFYFNATTYCRFYSRRFLPFPLNDALSTTQHELISISYK